jgi:hypothetical protein
VRRRLLRVGALEPGALGVGLLEAADADTVDRMVHGDAQAL